MERNENTSALQKLFLEQRAMAADTKIKLNIQTSENKIFPVVIAEKDTLEVLKSRIRDKTGFDMSSQHLFYNGDELRSYRGNPPYSFVYRDDFYGQTSKLVVDDRYFQTNRALFNRPPKSIQLVIQIEGTQQRVYTNIEKSDNVHFLKEKLRPQVFCSVENQKLILRGVNQNNDKELEDYLTVGECGIQEGSMLLLRLNDPDLQIPDQIPGRLPPDVFALFFIGLVILFVFIAAIAGQKGNQRNHYY